jgi:hypothetical protein
MPAPLKSDKALDRRRRRVLGPTYSLFYRGAAPRRAREGVWIHDSEVARYLDAYNNVPVVGHCHPRDGGGDRAAGEPAEYPPTRFLIDEPTLARRAPARDAAARDRKTWSSLAAAARRTYLAVRNLQGRRPVARGSS